MFSTSTLVSATFILAAAIQRASAEFAINTPDFVQCQPAKISWAAADGPYNLAVVDSNDPCGPVLLDLGDHDGTHITYTVALEAGKQVMLSLLDSKDNEAWSGNITVKAGDSSCLTGSAATDTATATGSSAPAVASTVTDDGANFGTTLVASGAGLAATTTASQGSATAVGAANAGLLPNGVNGAVSVHLSRAATVFGSAAAIFAVFAL